ncbi:MAG: 50S ribosomal protein L23 [Candidatus Berkelbacteria bacterium]|nr:50S ribosomal protein L23 [Candidatus Berkelbacteria bacterium]
MNNLVIKSPVISEKSFALASTGVYVFLVTPEANKKIVATQVHEMYKVDVEEVRIINIPGKIKRAGKKMGRRSDIKKALVKVKKGQKIAIFEEEKSDKKKEETTQIVDTEKTQKKPKAEVSEKSVK